MVALLVVNMDKLHDASMIVSTKISIESCMKLYEKYIDPGTLPTAEVEIKMYPGTLFLAFPSECM